MGPLVQYSDDSLEDLQTLIAMKETVHSPAFAELVGEMENDEVRRTFTLIARDAEGERRQLESVLRDWTRPAREQAKRALDAPGAHDVPTYREIVAQWRDLSRSSAQRARRAASRAPAPDLRARLEALAARDEAHAALLNALL